MNNSQPRQHIQHQPPHIIRRNIIQAQPYYTELQIQQIADEITNALLYPEPSFTDNNTRYNEPNYTRSQQDDIHPEDDLFYLIFTIREQMGLYNENMRQFLRTMNNIQTNIVALRRAYLRRNRTTSEDGFEAAAEMPHPSRTNNRHPNRNAYRHEPVNARPPGIPTPTPRPTTNPFINIISNIIDTVEPIYFQDVVVRPTEEQIDRALRMINYSVNSENISTNCPITLENFEEGQPICQIINCGHCFSEAAIKNWFRSHVRCPVCRYDIRGDVETPSPQPEPTANVSDGTSPSPPQQQPQRIPIPNFSRNFNDILSNLFTQNIYNYNTLRRDASTNLVYAFDIYYDPSYNYYESSNLDAVD